MAKALGLLLEPLMVEMVQAGEPLALLAVVSARLQALQEVP